MASYKSCPSCHAEVPASAARCKTCFHDFKAKKARNLGPVLLLASFTSMTLIGAVVFAVVTMQPVDTRILVDQETKSVIVTTKYRTGPVTKRIPWDDVAKVQYVTTSEGKFNIVVVTRSNESEVIQASDEPMASDAAKYATMIGKPLEQVDESGLITDLKQK